MVLLRQDRFAGGRARRGAGWQTQMAENLLNHRRIFGGGPSTGLRTGDDLQAAAAVRAVFHVNCSTTCPARPDSFISVSSFNRQI